MSNVSIDTVDKKSAAKRRSTVLWVVGLAFVGLMFDGYDLVIFGSVLPGFMRPDGLIFNDLSAAHQQALAAWAASGPHPSGTPVPPDVLHAQAAAKAIGGLLGSYALVGVLVGSLTAGTFADLIGRRKVMLIAYAWFSLAMGVTAMMTSVTAFGFMRFVTGIGVGALVAVTGALVSEYAPPGKKNVANALVYAGVPVGSMMAALLAIVLLDVIGWTGLFWLGAIPFVTLLPLAIFKMPESVAWLAARGRMDEARALSERTGVPIPAAPVPVAQPQSKAVDHAGGRAGWAGLFGRDNFPAAFVIGLTSVTALCLVYMLNTWLPALMTPLLGEKAGLALLLVLNCGAAIGGLLGSTFADKFGPKPTVAVCFLIGATSIFLVTTTQILGLLLAVIAIVGLGTTGTQTLIYGLVANYFRTNVRSAGIAWCAGFGRLGGIGGPLLGGWLGIVFADDLNKVFYVLAGIAVVGMCLTLAIPPSKAPAQRRIVTVEPTVEKIAAGS